MNDLQLQFFYFSVLQKERRVDLIDADKFYYFIPCLGQGLSVTFAKLLTIATPCKDSVSRNAKALEQATKHPRKQVCLNDDLNYESKKINENLRLISNFYESTFPAKSSFEV